MKIKFLNRLIFGFAIPSIFIILGFSSLFAQASPKEPITINGDNVEYSTTNTEVTAAGNVSILYKDTKLSCEKITINTVTKEATATGNVRLEDKKGVIEGKTIRYNFQNKTGTIMDASFRSNPFFGKADKLEKVSDAQYISHHGFLSTCSYDYPHYRMKARKMDFYPGDKVIMNDVLMTTGQYKQVPVLSMPQYNQAFRDEFMKVELMPGKKKDWGYYMLTGWRYKFDDNLKGRLYLDYRANWGIAEGFDTNYTNPKIGKGDFKFYYTQERDKSGELGEDPNIPKVFERYFVRWRHKWDIDQKTNFISQYYRIVDSKRAIFGSDYNVLKDYFPREFDLDSQPLSYAQLHRNFDYSSIDFLFQPRVNNWYSQLEKLPEAKFSLPSLQLGQTPVYFENSSSFAKFIFKFAKPTTIDDTSVARTDTYNKLSLPAKVAFLSFTPFVANRETYYSKDINNKSIAPRAIFYAGADLSTKFYRVFNVNTNFLNLDINGMRHIITPIASYAYNHKPTISSTRLKQIDSLDAIDTSNSVTFGLQNKLQTKRQGQSVDLVDLRVDTGYKILSVDPMSGQKSHGTLNDFVIHLDLIPYSWMRMVSDATYSKATGYISNVNADLNFDFGNERSIGIGERYQRRGGKELTFSAIWRFNPKWKFEIYERYQVADLSSSNKGLMEERYTLSRDLHCWIMDISWSRSRTSGSTFWCLFTMKAFPEIGFDLDKTYNAPKHGSQLERY